MKKRISGSLFIVGDFLLKLLGKAERTFLHILADCCCRMRAHSLIYKFQPRKSAYKGISASADELNRL